MMKKKLRRNIINQENRYKKLFKKYPRWPPMNGGNYLSSSITRNFLLDGLIFLICASSSQYYDFILFVKYYQKKIIILLQKNLFCIKCVM